MRHDRVYRDPTPIDMGEEDNRDVGQQRGAQDLEHARDGVERPGQHQYRDRCSGDHRPKRLRAGMQQMDTRTNGQEIGGNIQAVREEQPAEQDSHRRTPKAPEPGSGERSQTLAGGQRGSITDLLHAGHEGKGDQRRPEQTEPELRAGLRISRDT